MFKKILIILFSFVLSSSILAKNIRVGHGVPETASLHEGFVKFKELVESHKTANLKVDIFPNQQLGGDRELIEGLQFENVDMTAVSATNIASFSPKFFVFDLFFQFDNHQHVDRFFQTNEASDLLNYLDEIGIRGMGFMENGFRNLTNSKHDVNKITDLSGLKIRVAENPVQIEAWSALGTNPTPMAWGELFTGLQQKTVDGQETSIELIYSQRFYEVQKTISLTKHIYTPFIMLVSKSFYEELSDIQKEVINNASIEAAHYQRNLARRKEKSSLKLIKEAGLNVIEIDESEREELKNNLGNANKMVEEKAGDAYKLFINGVNKSK